MHPLLLWSVVGGWGLASGISQRSATLTVEAAYACSTLGAQDVLSPQWLSFIYLATPAPDSLGLEADLNSNQFLLSPFLYKNLGH